MGCEQIDTDRKKGTDYGTSVVLISQRVPDPPIGLEFLGEVVPRDAAFAEPRWQSPKGTPHC